MNISSNGVSFKFVNVVGSVEEVPTDLTKVFEKVVDDTTGLSYVIYINDEWSSIYGVETEMQPQADALGKHEVKVVKAHKKNYLLSGTCLSFEDALCGNVEDALKVLSDVFGKKIKGDSEVDAVSEIRDFIIEKYCEYTSSVLVVGNNNY